MTTHPSCRLPDSVIPSAYNLRLTPDLERFTFKGVVFINVTVSTPVREITLHAADLEITSSDVRLWDTHQNDPHMPDAVRLDPKNETATFVFAQDLLIGDAILEITYSGMLNDKMVGFYRSKYTAADGTEKHLATTQFEATDARRALPCWDEPARKAIFGVTLVVPRALTALSNMPVEATYVRDGDLKEVVFQRTPMMSTYLLAFIVGDLEFVEAITSNSTRVRAYALPGKSAQGRFALDVAKRTLEFYNEYFGIPYPLPKLDMAAIPDFASGAMENWGLVTYRENAILIDPTNSSSAAHQRVAEVVTHELAHQWFGNLVTMEWWTNLWLNEGFASWMACFAMSYLFPGWDIWTQFVGKDYANALSLDGLRSTHPIEVPVGHPNEISQIFDAISYSKGASVIRMIHDFIGANAFRSGLQTYLRRHAYGNAVTEDLWAALDEASGQPVRQIMDTWTKQPGYPLITLDTDGRSSHQRFLAGGEALTPEESRQGWHFPFAQRGPKFNLGQILVARVNYPPEQWRHLAVAVSKGTLPPVDRYGLASDALALARAGHLGTDHLVNLLSSYANETDYTVWTAVLGALGALDTILEETSDEARLASFARTLLSPINNTLGWEEHPDEPHTTKLLRGMVFNALGGYGDQDTLIRAVVLFNGYTREGRSLNPNLRAAVYGINTKSFGDRFNDFLRLYEKETFQEEKVRLLNALGNFRDPAPLSRALDYAFNSGKVRHGDLGQVLSAMGSHARGRRIAWQFFTDNWDEFNKRYTGGGLKMLGRLISTICNSFARAEDADAIEQFFKEHSAPSATRAVAESLERIRVRAAWYQRDQDRISNALSK